MNADAPLYPEFHRLLGRTDKEQLLGQRGGVVWLFGRSGSGKSTLVAALERRLHTAGLFTVVLDGDNIRTGLNRDLGFSETDRRENLRRIAEVARLFKEAGVLTLVSFITPLESARQAARAIIGPADLALVFVRASFATCAARDPKGLYAAGAAGQAPQFTPAGMIFEEPADPDLILPNDDTPLETNLDRLHALVHHRFSLSA